MRTTITAERELDAPAPVVYHLLADYRTHHRPEGYLPPAFSDMQVLKGGVGDGTEARWTVDAGGRRTITATITEPVPGHTLLETADGLTTTFTVDPIEAGSRVRFVTVIDEPAAGDHIAIHWDWACERLDARQLAALQLWTGRELAVANRTM